MRAELPFALALMLMWTACHAEEGEQDVSTSCSPSSTSAVWPTAREAAPGFGEPVGSHALDPQVVEGIGEHSGTLLLLEERPAPDHRVTALDLGTGQLSAFYTLERGRFLLDMSASAHWLVLSLLAPPDILDEAVRYQTAGLERIDLSRPAAGLLSPALAQDEGTRWIDPAFGAGALFAIAASELPELELTLTRLDLESGMREPLRQHVVEPLLTRDGRTLTYIKVDPSTGGTHIERAESDGTQPVALTSPADFHGVALLALSADEQWLYFSALRSAGDVSAHGEHSSAADWWRVRVAGGEPERIVPVGEAILGSAMGADGALFFSTSLGVYVAKSSGETMRVQQLLRTRAARALVWLP